MSQSDTPELPMHQWAVFNADLDRREAERAPEDDTQTGALRGVDGHCTRIVPSPTGAASARGALEPPAPGGHTSSLRDLSDGELEELLREVCEEDRRRRREAP
jgi:hypothetical protein